MATELDNRGLPHGYPFQPEWEVTPRQVRQARTAGEPMILIDCRTPLEYETARIEGALLVPLQEFSERIASLREHEDQRVVVFCHHGARGLQFTAALRHEGFSDVHSMAGGIHLWSLDIDPSVPVY
ncbi:MAG: rhodanese [Planctomycetes bacterium]|nr:rhodanese [Planctomycetota bacterium]